MLALPDPFQRQAFLSPFEDLGVICSNVCMCTVGIYNAHRGQKRILVVVSYHVGVGDQTWVLCKSKSF